MDPRELHRHWQQLRYQADQEAGLEAEEEQRQRSWLDLRETRYGTFRLEGELDAESGALVRAAIRGQMGRRARDDRRTAGERRAASLAEVARYRLDAGDLPTRGGQRPHLTLIAELSTLRLEPGSRLATLDWGPRAPRGADRPGGDETAPPLACRSRSMKHGAARTWRRRRRWQAALRTTGQSGTARRAGSGKTRREGVREEPAL
jgi:hypothetical protein